MIKCFWRNIMLKKTLKIIAITMASIVGLIVLTLSGYIIYLSATYYRIEDNYNLEINNNNENNVSINTEYKISTYNIGFGAYTQDFTFFMDTGTMKDGTKVTGSQSRAKSKESVIECTNGAIQTISQTNSDFIFFQEVDTSSHRSYFVNQYELLTNSFSEYANVFASNFHSGYLFYPITNPHGSVQSGIVTYSKYGIKNSVRKSFPIDEGFFSKFFDLDRCFTVSRIGVNNSNKELVLINLHMSAYDEGGKIRAKQLELLSSFISEEYNKGNYIIAGGDWNHDIAKSLNTFQTEQEVPEWVNVINDDDIPNHFSFATSKEIPTYRSSEIPYTKGINYTVVIDGFIISDNIEMVICENVDTGFKYSDHNPASLTFKLKDVI